MAPIATTPFRRRPCAAHRLLACLLLASVFSSGLAAPRPAIGQVASSVASESDGPKTDMRPTPRPWVWFQSTEQRLDRAYRSTAGTRARPAGTARQRRWLQASIEERVRQAEQLGERGARAFAKAKGWTPLLDGTEKRLSQGLDQVYRDRSGVIHVVEAKGGTSSLGRGYGHAQATTEWAVEAAKRTIRSAKASPAERRAARAVLEGASERTLKVHVIRTHHILGEPTHAVLEQSTECTHEAARMAKDALQRLEESANGRGVARAGAATRTAETPCVETAETLPAAERPGVGRWPAKRIGRGATRAVELHPSTEAGGAAALSETGEALGAATKGGKLLRTGGKILAVAGAAIDVALRAEEAAQVERQYAAGSISRDERVKAHAKNAAGFASGWTGAWAGSQAGATAGAVIGTVIPGPGSAVGAAIGGLAGGVAGYCGGEMVGEAAAEKGVDIMNRVAPTVRKKIRAAKKMAKDVQRAVGETVSSWLRWVPGHSEQEPSR